MTISQLSERTRLILAALREPRSLRLFYQGLALAPRLIVHLASVAVLAGLSVACVPAAQYEEAKSASEVELAARQHAEADLVATRAKLELLTEQLNERDVKLSASEQSASESKLLNSVAQKERDEATGLVDQLRGELGRVGEDLRSYAKQKADLEASLATLSGQKKALEQNDARTAALLALTRDLTAALSDHVLSGDMTLALVNSKLALGGQSALWFNDDATLSSASPALVSAVARVLSLHAGTTVEVRSSAGAELGEQRAQALSAALSGRGVASTRIETAAGPIPVAADATATGDSAAPTPAPSSEIVLTFSVP